jgi:hypothetical protein
MTGTLFNPWMGHGAIVALALVSFGVMRVAYIAPRERMLDAMRAEERQLAAHVSDLEDGMREMQAWARLHPGQKLLLTGARRLPPASDMVPAFLKAMVPIADRHRITTTAIEPTAAVSETTVTDAVGTSRPCRMTELDLRIRARYRDLGEYLAELETMDQLVAVRPVTLHYEVASYPELAADLAVRLYGTP